MKNCLIIGASSGIGKNLANMLADSGNKVYGTFCTKPIQNNKPGPEYHFCNVLEETLNFDFLPDILDGLVYCPGSINLKPFIRITPDEFVRDFNLQVVGAVKVIQAVLQKLKSSESASIVLFSTVAVKSGWITGQVFHVDGGISTLKI